MNRESHDRKVEEIARELQSQGFSVVVEPSPEYLPTWLEGYVPDLLGRKGEEGVVVEVKSSLDRVSVEKYMRVAEQVRSKGWRFMLVTLEDINTRTTPSSLDTLPSWSEIASRLAGCRKVAEIGVDTAAQLYLWATLEAAMRRRAIEANIPAERLQSRNLMRNLYTLGEISVEYIDVLESLHVMRNWLAHGGREAPTPHITDKAIAIAFKLVSDWAIAREEG